MIRSFKTLALIAAVALPDMLSAQTPVDATVEVTINAFPRPTTAMGYPTSLRGGGFAASFSVDFPGGTTSFTDYLVWCIDVTRYTSVGSTSTYQLYTVADFAETAFGTLTNDPNLQHMQEIASIVADLEDNWSTPAMTVDARRLRQGQIWDRFTGNDRSNYDGDPNFDASGWFVLYNGQRQTFLTRLPVPSEVPEPSSLAMLGLGLAGLVAVRRRRRTT
jgi:hypothetical protein